MADRGKGQDALATSLEGVRKLIKGIRDRRERIGETNTRAVLVEPVLSALEWDPTDIAEVYREYRRKPQDNPVDYALLSAGKPRLFVEAKELGKNLQDRKWVSQVLGYATVVGVEWCVLTDGDEYRIYNAHAAVDAEEKLFRSVRISERKGRDEATESLRLLSKSALVEDRIGALWRAHFIDRHIREALEALTAGPDDALVRWIRKRVPELRPAEIKESLQRAEVDVSFRATPPKPIKRPPPTSPKPVGPRSRLTVDIAGQSRSCTSYKGMLVHVAEWVVAEGKLAPSDCPVIVTRAKKGTRKRCLVNGEPQHPGGQPFVSPKALSNGLFLEAAGGAKGVTRMARALLRWAGLDPDTLVIPEASD